MKNDVKVVGGSKKPGDLKWFNDYPEEGIVYSQPPYIE